MARPAIRTQTQDTTAANRTQAGNQRVQQTDTTQNQVRETPRVREQGVGTRLDVKA